MWRQIALSVFVLGLVLCFAGCSDTSANNVPDETLKIGLIAPFEGRYREIGVDVIPAARLAIQEWAERPESRYLAIELVAYDDRGHGPTAQEQAERLTQDRAIKVVIGHWLDQTTYAALPHYEDSRLPLITFSQLPADYAAPMYSFNSIPHDAKDAAPAITASSPDLSGLPVAEITDIFVTEESFTSEPQVVIGDSRFATRQLALLFGDSYTSNVFFVSTSALPDLADETYWNAQTINDFGSRFADNSLGAPPGMFSRQAYEATWLAIVWIAESRGLSITGTPVDHFNFHEVRVSDAPYYVYRWEKDQRDLVATVK